jgi:hypothetical protein
MLSCDKHFFFSLEFLHGNIQILPFYIFSSNKTYSKDLVPLEKIISKSKGQSPLRYGKYKFTPHQR